MKTMQRLEFKTNPPIRTFLLALILAIPIQFDAGGRAFAATASVSAFNFGFSPPSVTINVGDSVRWTGLGSSHNVQTDTDPFCGNVPVTGGTCTIPFNQAGTFNYYCAPHRGRVSSSSSPATGRGSATPRASWARENSTPMTGREATTFACPLQS